MDTTPLTPLSPAPTVGLVLETDDQHTGWAILRSTASGVTVTRGIEPGGINRDTRRKLTLAAVDEAVALGFAEEQIVDLMIYNAPARNELTNLGQMFSLVHVTQRESIDFDHDTYQQVRANLTEDVSARSTGSAATAPRKLMVAASDGGYHAHFGGGAYGWVRDDGKFGYGTARGVDSALEAELHGLLNLVKHTPAGSNLLVLVDSRAAIDVVNLEGVTSRGAEVSGKAFALVERIVWFRANRVDFRLEWVKGHDGHPLNDGADRLARLSRQSTDFGTPQSTVRTIAQAIVDDALAGRSLALAS